MAAVAAARSSAAASAASLPRIIRASHASGVDSGHRPASASIIQHATATTTTTATTGPAADKGRALRHLPAHRWPVVGRRSVSVSDKARSEERQNEAHLGSITPNLILAGGREDTGRDGRAGRAGRVWRVLARVGACVRV